MWDWGALLLFLFRGGQRAALSWAPALPAPPARGRGGEATRSACRWHAQVRGRT